jgi:sulfopyruvate decarboxylase subunit alpha
VAKVSRIIDALEACGVTHLLGVPDNTSAALFLACAERTDLRLITVTREGEAFAIASGLWLGGAVPALVIQNTGLLESGDAYRGTALRMRVPLLCLVTVRGYAALERAATETRASPTPDDLGRADLDSAALLMEPTLRAWSLPFEYLHEDADVDRIPAAFRRAGAESRPVAVLITRTITP